MEHHSSEHEMEHNMHNDTDQGNSEEQIEDFHDNTTHKIDRFFAALKPLFDRNMLVQKDFVLPRDILPINMVQTEMSADTEFAEFVSELHIPKAAPFTNSPCSGPSNEENHVENPEVHAEMCVETSISSEFDGESQGELYSSCGHGSEATSLNEATDQNRTMTAQYYMESSLDMKNVQKMAEQQAKSMSNANPCPDEKIDDKIDAFLSYHRDNHDN